MVSRARECLFRIPLRVLTYILNALNYASVRIHVKDITCIDYRSKVYIHVPLPGSFMLLRMLRIARVYVHYGKKKRKKKKKHKGRGGEEINSPMLAVVVASS